MEQEKMQAVALMRYSAIAPLITGLQEDYSSRDAFFRDASLKGVTAPDGSIKHMHPAPLKNGIIVTRNPALTGSSLPDVPIWVNPENWMMLFRNRSVT